MAHFTGSITDAQATAIVHTLFQHLVSTSNDGMVDRGRSTVAAIICDAVHADITLQPLHDAYGRFTHTRIDNPTTDAIDILVMGRRAIYNDDDPQLTIRHMDARNRRITNAIAHLKGGRS